MRKNFSVIIPIYNAEKYIEQCVESIGNDESTEIILVNDGSEDNSLSLCQKLANRNKNIIVIDSQNFGVSHARNKGIDIARGKWILFIDSDDYISPKALSIISKALRSIDNEKILLRFGMTKDYYSDDKLLKSRSVVFKSFEKSDTNELKKFIVDDDFVELFENEAFDSACVCVFNADLIHSENLKFKESMRIREDTEFILNYCRCIKEIFIFNNFLYHYRIIGDDTYAFRRNVDVSDLELLSLQYGKILKRVTSNKKSTLLVNNLIYQTLVCGLVHNSQKKHNKKFSDLQKYISIVVKSREIQSVLTKTNQKSYFHKIMVLLLRRRFVFLSAVLCKIKFSKIT